MSHVFNVPVDITTTTGWSGEGTMTINGMPPWAWELHQKLDRVLALLAVEGLKESE